MTAAPRAGAGRRQTDRQAAPTSKSASDRDGQTSSADSGSDREGHRETRRLYGAC